MFTKLTASQDPSSTKPVIRTIWWGRKLFTTRV